MDRAAFLGDFLVALLVLTDFLTGAGEGERDRDFLIEAGTSEKRSGDFLLRLGEGERAKVVRVVRFRPTGSSP